VEHRVEVDGVGSAATQVAPIRPPNNACDELEGRPRYQVIRFHRIAPTSPAKITTGLMRVSSTSPPEIVFATWTERNTPTRLRQPAIATATLGLSAPVAIEVAMAFAVSWKPFVKSKINAVRTTTTTIRDSYTAVPFARPDAGTGRGCGVVRAAPGTAELHDQMSAARQGPSSHARGGRAPARNSTRRR